MPRNTTASSDIGVLAAEFAAVTQVQGNAVTLDDINEIASSVRLMSRL
jgi:hypothetical protein